MNHNGFQNDQQKIKQIWLVTYLNRSGSTFLLNELNKYKQIVSLPEGERLVKFLLKNPAQSINDKKRLKNQINKMIQRDQKLRLFGVALDDSDLFECQIYAEVFLKFVIKSARYHKPDSEIIVFKDTRLIKYFSRIKQKTNSKIHIKFVVLTRDPRAIYNSQKKTIGSWGVPMSTNPVITAYDWNRFQWLKHSIKCRISEHLFELKYEKIIINLREEIEQLFNHFGLDPNSLVRTESAKYLELIPDSLKSIHENINKKPIPEKIDNWMNDLGNCEIRIIQKIVKSYIIPENYKLVKTNFDFHYLLLAMKWYLYFGLEKFKRVVFPNRDLPLIK